MAQQLAQVAAERLEQACSSGVHDAGRMLPVRGWHGTRRQGRRAGMPKPLFLRPQGSRQRSNDTRCGAANSERPQRYAAPHNRRAGIAVSRAMTWTGTAKSPAKFHIPAGECTAAAWAGAAQPRHQPPTRPACPAFPASLSARSPHLPCASALCTTCRKKPTSPTTSQPTNSVPTWQLLLGRQRHQLADHKVAVGALAQLQQLGLQLTQDGGALCGEKGRELKA